MFFENEKAKYLLSLILPYFPNTARMLNFSINKVLGLIEYEFLCDRLLKMKYDSNYDVLSSVAPKYLTYFNQPSLIKFEIEYTGCKEKNDNVNKDRDDQKEIQVASIKLCMVPSILHELCIMSGVKAPSLLSRLLSIESRIF